MSRAATGMPGSRCSGKRKQAPFRRVASVPAPSLRDVGHSEQLQRMPLSSAGNWQPFQVAWSSFSPMFDIELDSGRQSRGPGGAFDRCRSEHAFAQAGDAISAGGGTPLQQLLQLCRSASPFNAQLAHHLHALRVALAAPQPQQQDQQAMEEDGQEEQQQQQQGRPVSPTTAAAAVDPAALDVEAIACELLALGYSVQVRDEAQSERPRDVRSCLQHLRHRFIVCIGGAGADGEPLYLPEPLVVEPRFREQFCIAHPTDAYAALLQAVPPCFVGGLAQLQAVVALLCDEMMAAFKSQGLAVPPWRSKQAMMSKWGPAQLAALATKIADMRRIMEAPLPLPPLPAASAVHADAAHVQGGLCMGERPAAQLMPHAAFGSAPGRDHDITHVSGTSPDEAQQQQQQQQVVVPQGVVAATVGQAHLEAAWPGGTPHPQPQQQQRGVVWQARDGGSLQECQIVAPQQQQQRRSTSPPFAELAASGNVVHSSRQQQREGEPRPTSCAPMHGVADGAVRLNVDATSVALKFTRKASAEWKGRASGKKTKSLLAAALKRTGGGRDSSGGGCMRGGGLPLGAAAAAVAAAAVAAGGAGVTDAAAAMRRAHIRTTGDQPWSRITTVKWGAAYSGGAGGSAGSGGHDANVGGDAAAVEPHHRPPAPAPAPVAAATPARWAAA